MIHIIGEKSEYDEDMNLIESMIQFTENNNNTDGNFIKSYYINSLNKYWDNFIKYLNNDLFFKDKNNIFKRIDYIINLNANGAIEINKVFCDILRELVDYVDNIYERNFNEICSSEAILLSFIKRRCNPEYDSIIEYLYEKYPNIKNHITNTEKTILGRRATYDELYKYSLFKNKAKRKYLQKNIKYYNDIFIKKYKEIYNSDLNMDKIINLFIYIAGLFCLAPMDGNTIKNDQNINNILKYNKNFIIANDTGFFSYNTWLYSFFNGINLIGTSSGLAHYDGNTECAMWMLYHDLLHYKDIYNSYNNIFVKIYEYIWYIILNSKISKLEKELNIYILWIDLHETYKDNKIYLHNFIYDDFDYIFKIYLKRIFKRAFILVFLEEFNKYRNFIEKYNKYAMEYTSIKFPKYYKFICNNEKKDLLLIANSCFYYFIKNIKDNILLIS